MPWSGFGRRAIHTFMKICTGRPQSLSVTFEFADKKLFFPRSPLLWYPRHTLVTFQKVSCLGAVSSRVVHTFLKICRGSLSYVSVRTQEACFYIKTYWERIEVHSIQVSPFYPGSPAEAAGLFSPVSFVSTILVPCAYLCVYVC